MKIANSEKQISSLWEVFPHISNKRVSEDFFWTAECSGSIFKQIEGPSLFNGYFACFFKKADFFIEMNKMPYHITDGTVLMYVPGNTLAIPDKEAAEDAKFVAIAETPKLLQRVKLSSSILYGQSMKAMFNPCFLLGDKEKEICAGYCRLAEKLINAEHPNLEKSLVSLASSLFHFLGNHWSEQILEEHKVDSSSIRSQILFEKFLELVSEYHCYEREVKFYADRLDITPKYLSQLVNKISGRSAPDWISSLVILEAKNYLKYSTLDIKEVAFNLNFNSTPAFFRYFKAHTGMTPLEFRKS